MNKEIKISLLIVVIAAASFFAGSFMNEPKQVVTPETVVKAEMPLKNWDGILITISRQAAVLQNSSKYPKDTKPHVDTINMAIQAIAMNINDTVRNPVFKKK